MLARLRNVPGWSHQQPEPGHQPMRRVAPAILLFGLLASASRADDWAYQALVSSRFEYFDDEDLFPCFGKIGGRH